MNTQSKLHTTSNLKVCTGETEQWSPFHSKFSLFPLLQFSHFITFASWTTGFRSNWNKLPRHHIPEPGLTQRRVRSILTMNVTKDFRNSLNTTCQRNPTLCQEIYSKVLAIKTYKLTFNMAADTEMPNHSTVSCFAALLKVVQFCRYFLSHYVHTVFWNAHIGVYVLKCYIKQATQPSKMTEI